MGTHEFVQRRDSILSVFNQSRNELIALNAEIDKAVESNMKEFERIRIENESLLELKGSNQKVLEVLFGKILIDRV